MVLASHHCLLCHHLFMWLVQTATRNVHSTPVYHELIQTGDVIRLCRVPLLPQHLACSSAEEVVKMRGSLLSVFSFTFPTAHVYKMLPKDDIVVQTSAVAGKVRRRERAKRNSWLSRQRRV